MATVTVNARFLILTAFAVSVTLFAENAYAQSESEQTTLSEDLKNDPVAQDILKKIEQTKKMIEDLQQKEYEQNQAQENLERARIMSLEQLNQDLKEWERIWEQHSSRNAFDSFVSKKPEYVQGVFWDQFEFKEQKVKAGRIAMNQVLASGGTMQAAKDAYNRAATTQRIELIEVNSQFNVKHNLADYKEQQLFNSTGQVHFSPLTKSKISEFYSDYKLQPNYVMANPDDASVSAQRNLQTGKSGVLQCEEGFVLVSRIISEHMTCVDESTAENWINKKVPGIMIYNNDFEISSDVKTNPATDCGKGYQVVYHIIESEYQCVSDYDAKQMISNNTAEIHTLVEYIHNKDKQKITADKIYEINQKITKINEDYSDTKKNLESKYQEILQSEEAMIKQKIRQAIKDYKDNPDSTRETLSKSISQLNDENDTIKEKITKEKKFALLNLESKQKSKILDAVKGYEGNPDIKLDWNAYLDETSKPESKQETSTSTIISQASYEESNNDLDSYTKKTSTDNISIVNPFGQKPDSIESGQVLQIVADITNPSKLNQNFVYMLDIKDSKDNPIRPTQWMTGTLAADQTFNVGISWIPEESGEFTATVSAGNSIDSISHVADVGITVS